MVDSFRMPVFLSLKWKSVITIGVLFVTIAALLSWHLNRRYEATFADYLNDLRLENIEALEATIHRSGESLLQRLNDLLVETNDGAESSNAVLRYRSSIEQQLPQLANQWGVDTAYLVDTANHIVWQYSDNEPNGDNLDTLLSASNYRQLPSTSINCRSRCQQLVVKPVYHGNESVGALVVTRPIHYLADQFFALSHSYLGILTLDDFSEEANRTVTADGASVYLNSWRANLRAHWPDADLLTGLRVAAAYYTYAELAGDIKKVDYGRRHFAISILPVRGTTNQNTRYVLMTDVSATHQRIIGNLIQDSLITLCLIFVFASYIAFMSWRYIRRINQQLQVLPMLGQKQFHEVRNMISQNRRARIYHDEFDHLDNSVTALTYQLESLEKAVSLRNKEMERLSLFDSLTGLANRNLFLYELQHDVQRFQQQGGMLAIVILDLDKFKRINDTLGHQLGDILLGKIGSRLRTATRNLGLVARLGGDEFALILRSAKKYAQVEVLCQKILDLVHKPIELDQHTVVISCSLGISLAGTAQSATDLVKNAEIAMYKAKESGGNAYRVFNAVMATEAHANLSLEAEIRRAFDNKEFTLYLQPKVNMDSQIEGFESLVRWDHPDRGILPPNEFIPAMENMGLISRLDNFVLDASCRQLKVLQLHYPNISIAVNISSTHFTDKNFLVFLKDCLNQYPINPSKLELEITETLLMENMNVGMEIIKQIKELGVSIAIDDFGTGYSSLSYLKKLPVDTIKIDREFIKDIPDSESDMQISSVIIFLAKQLNFKVVAEGVETSEQLVFLKANHCDLAQGFYFSKPIPAHKSMIMLESQRKDKKFNIN